MEVRLREATKHGFRSSLKARADVELQRNTNLESTLHRAKPRKPRALLRPELEPQGFSFDRVFWRATDAAQFLMTVAAISRAAVQLLLVSLHGETGACPRLHP